MDHPDKITIHIYIYMYIPIYVSVKECVRIQTVALLVTLSTLFGNQKVKRTRNIYQLLVFASTEPT